MIKENKENLKLHKQIFFSWLVVSLTQPRFIWEEGVSFEGLHMSDLPTTSFV